MEVWRFLEKANLWPSDSIICSWYLMIKSVNANVLMSSLKCADVLIYGSAHWNVQMCQCADVILEMCYMLRVRRRPFHVPLGRPKEVAWAECAAPADGIRLKKRSSVRHNPLSRSTTFQAGEFNLAGQIVGGAVMVCKPPQIQDKKPQLKWRPHFQSICQQKCWNLCASEFVFLCSNVFIWERLHSLSQLYTFPGGTSCSQDP